MTHTGGCLCGAVRYETDGPLRPVIACHCGQCRKSSGHHVAATSARRGFCPACGSNLFRDGPGDNLSIFAGTLDGDAGIRLEGHIYCADKGACHEIADGLPQAPRRDPGLTTMAPGKR